MKKSEIEVGKTYVAKVGGKLTRLRVDAIRDQVRITSRTSYTGMRCSETRQVYDVTNLATGRRTTFRSAAKFRQAVNSMTIKPKPKPNTTQFGSQQSGFPEDGGTAGGPTFLPRS